jgi:rhodanese-related sulfurtransferase
MLPQLQLIIAVAVLPLIAVPNALASGQSCLTAREQEYAAQFSQVDQVLPHDLAALLKHPDDLVVLDIREDGEYAVGTIKGGIRVSPSIDFDALLRQIGPSVAGKTVIVFCSVGYRSSKLASRVRAGLLERGVVRVANLRGGIFAWHNYGRPLVDRFGATNYVHPYSGKWKQYLDFDNLARMTARRDESE